MHPLVADLKAPRKDWPERFYWVNKDKVGDMLWRTEAISDKATPLDGDDAAVASALRDHQVVGMAFPEVFLAGAGMSTSWRIRGKMPSFVVKIDGRFLFGLLFVFSSLPPPPPHFFRVKGLIVSFPCRCGAGGAFC